jgi:hypothetical protein
MTRNPRLENIRHSPATMIDFPASEAVPCIMREGVNFGVLSDFAAELSTDISSPKGRIFFIFYNASP